MSAEAWIALVGLIVVILGGIGGILLRDIERRLTSVESKTNGGHSEAMGVLKARVGVLENEMTTVRKRVHDIADETQRLITVVEMHERKKK